MGPQGALSRAAAPLAGAFVAVRHQHVRLARLHHHCGQVAVQRARRHPGLHHADFLGGDRGAAVFRGADGAQLDGRERRSAGRGALAMA